MATRPRASGSRRARRRPSRGRAGPAGLGGEGRRGVRSWSRTQPEAASRPWAELSATGEALGGEPGRGRVGEPRRWRRRPGAGGADTEDPVGEEPARAGRTEGAGDPAGVDGGGEVRQRVGRSGAGRGDDGRAGADWATEAAIGGVGAGRRDPAPGGGGAGWRDPAPGGRGAGGRGRGRPGGGTRRDRVEVEAGGVGRASRSGADCARSTVQARSDPRRGQTAPATGACRGWRAGRGLSWDGRANEAGAGEEDQGVRCKRSNEEHRQWLRAPERCRWQHA